MNVLIIILFLVIYFDHNYCLNCTYVEDNLLKMSTFIDVSSFQPKEEARSKHNVRYPIEKSLAKFCTRTKPVLTLKKLLLYDTKTLELGVDLFKNYHLEQFGCLFNHIKVISSRTFFNISLRKLELGHNNIELIEEEAFMDLECLVYLDLTTNKIALINHNMFRNLPKVNEFLVADNLLTVIGANDLDFLRAKPITCLSINNNTIRILHSQSMSNLTISTLYMEHNNLTEIKRDAFQNSCIDIIYMQGNNLSSFSKEYLNRICNITMVVVVSEPPFRILYEETQIEPKLDINMIIIISCIVLVVLIVAVFCVYYKIQSVGCQKFNNNCQRENNKE